MRHGDRHLEPPGSRATLAAIAPGNPTFRDAAPPLAVGIVMSSRTELRRRCRTARAALDESLRIEASCAIVAHLANSRAYREACHVAIYWPVADEVDLRGLRTRPATSAQRFYLPRILPAARAMEFLPLDDTTRLQRNDWGLLEPPEQPDAVIATTELDLVCVPLLGFDRSGNRLGQGGGYYDRAFAFTRECRRRAPILVGVAFACQELAALEPAPWDVPLGAVVTEHGLIDCTEAQRRNAR